MTDRPLIPRAHDEACRQGHDFVSTAHVLLAALDGQEDPLGILLRGAVPDEGRARRVIQETLPPTRDPRPGPVPMSHAVRVALERAARSAEDAGRARIEAEDLLLGLSTTPGSRAARALQAIRDRPGGA